MFFFKIRCSVFNKRASSELLKIYNQHSHKKRKDSLEGSLDRVLFIAELEFPKILVPRLPQNTEYIKWEHRMSLKIKTTLSFM